MNPRRPRSPYVVALVFLALTSACLGQRKAYISSFTPPVQNYAVIDISGAATETQNGDGTTTTSNVDLVALNDANRAAFGFGTGSGPGDLPFTFDTYNTFTWSNGTLDPTDHATKCFDYVGYLPPEFNGGYGTSQWLQRWPQTLLTTGKVYGNEWLFDLFDDGTGGDVHDYMFSSIGNSSAFDLPDPPFDNLRYYGSGLSDVSETGIVAGGADDFMVPPYTGSGSLTEFAFLFDGGSFTLFNPYSQYYTITVPPNSNIVVLPGRFSPNCVNNPGWAAGTGTSFNSATLWNGQTLISVGSGWAADLNDQGQVAIKGFDSQGNYLEGTMWENGSSTALRDELPFWFAWQISNIQPFLISNQVKPQPPAPALPDLTADATIHILATAQDLISTPQTTYVNGQLNTLWTRDNTNKWTYSEIALPTGTTITQIATINSSGVIAAIGNGGHALLLVPVGFNEQDGQINYGFDPPMEGLPASGDDEAVPADPPGEPVWTSVVSGSTSSVTNFICPPSIAPSLCLHVTSRSQYGALVAPQDAAALSSSPTSITISGAAGLTSVESLTIQPCIMGGTQPLAGPTLNVYALPARTVSVGIYDVIDSTSSSSYDVVDGVKTLANAPPYATIISTLDDVFKQAGVSFQLLGSGIQDVHYDLEKNGQTGKNAVVTITDSLADLPGAIHIYLTKSSGIQYVGDSTPYVRAFTAGGKNIFSFLFVDTIVSAGGSVELVGAHEMGHALSLTVRNPDDHGHDPGPFPSGTTGLMGSGFPDSTTGVEPANPGKWLPHEDWKEANEEAVEFHL